MPRHIFPSLSSFVLALTLGFGSFLLLAPRAQAVQLGQAYVRLDRLKEATATGGTVCAALTTAGSADAKIKVTFPAGFTVNSTPANWTVTTTDLPTGSAAMPGVATATAVGTQTVTFPISNITDTALYCFNFTGTSTLTTPAAANNLTGSISITTSADAEIDGGIYALSVVTNDQVLVTATVPATFSLALGTNTQALGILSTGSVTSGTGVSVTILTNASNGWLGWVRSANAALNSAVTGDSIGTTGALGGGPSGISAGTEGYVLDADLTTNGADGGTPSITTEYNGTTTSEGGTLSTIFQEFATANGPSGGDVVTLIPRVAISGLNQAATDYTDTLTIVAAGNF